MAMYTAQGVVNGILIEEKVKAVSEKQARFFFCQKHGFNTYDFKIINTKSLIADNHLQLSFF